MSSGPNPKPTRAEITVSGTTKLDGDPVVSTVLRERKLTAEESKQITRLLSRAGKGLPSAAEDDAAIMRVLGPVARRRRTVSYVLVILLALETAALMGLLAWVLS